MRLLDSSVVLASLLEAEPHHEACSALVLQGGHALYVHALAEVFSTLTGGAQGLRVGADLAQQLLRESVLPYVKTVTLAERDVMAALAQAQSRGVRGAAVYDYDASLDLRTRGLHHLLPARRFRGDQRARRLHCTDPAKSCSRGSVRNGAFASCSPLPLALAAPAEPCEGV